MNTNPTTEAIALLTAEIETAFIRRTDSPAAMILWKRLVGLLDEMVKEVKAA